MLGQALGALIIDLGRFDVHISQSHIKWSTAIFNVKMIGLPSSSDFVNFTEIFY